MNLRNFLTLTIQAHDFNFVAERPELVAKLRKLTLSPYSGLNHELNWMIRESANRKINCHIILAYRFRDLVGWGLLSRESTDFTFINTMSGFDSESGWLFQVFVDPKYRRQGIASELYKKARAQIKNELLCVCPWDERSVGFYNNFPDNNRWI